MRRTFGICFLVLLSAFCLWKYAERLTPMERLYSGNFSLEQLQREKCVIITDLCEIKKAELWEDFIKCDVTRSVSKMTEIERRGGKRWDKPKKAEKSRDCGGGKF